MIEGGIVCTFFLDLFLTLDAEDSAGDPVLALRRVDS